MSHQLEGVKRQGVHLGPHENSYSHEKLEMSSSGGRLQSLSQISGSVLFTGPSQICFGPGGNLQVGI